MLVWHVLNRENAVKTKTPQTLKTRSLFWPKQEAQNTKLKPSPEASRIGRPGSEIPMLILAHENGRPELRGPMSTRSSSDSFGAVFLLAPERFRTWVWVLVGFRILVFARHAGLTCGFGVRVYMLLGQSKVWHTPPEMEMKRS